MSDAGYQQVLATWDGLDPAVVHALINPDPRELEEIARQSGSDRILRNVTKLRWAAMHACSTRAQFDEIHSLVLPSMEHAAAFMHDRHGCEHVAAELAEFRAWTFDEVQATIDFWDRFRQVDKDSIPVEDRIAWVRANIGTCDSLLGHYGTAEIRYRLAQMYGELGRHGEALHVYEEMVWMSVARGKHDDIANFAGVVGGIHPDPDSSLYYYNLGLKVARDHELVYQQARILSFVGNRYLVQGRFGRAQRYYDDVLSLYERYPFALFAERFLREAAARYRRVGWYEEAERLVYQAALAIERTPREPDRYGMGRAVIDASRATIAVARGNDARARTLRDRALPILTGGEVELATSLMAEYATEQLRRGELAGCVETIEQGLTLWPGNERLDRYRRRLYAMQAYVLALLGRDADASSALDRYANESTPARRATGFGYGPDERMLVTVARARLALQAGADTVSVLDVVDRELAAVMAEPQPGAQRYLWLQRNTALRDFFEDLAGGDVMEQLGIDLYWRSLRSSGVPTRGVPLTRQWLSNSGSAVSLATRSRRDILVYSVHDDGIHRYLIRPEGIERTVIGMPIAELRSLVNEAWERLAADPGSPGATVDAGLAGRLHRLATVLLPDGLSRERGLLIMVDDFLARVPFEAFNLSPQQYAPLGDAHDVVYLHGIGAAGRRQRGKGSVIVGDPTIPIEVRRRIPGQLPLPEARVEAEYAAERLPDPQVAVGAGATVSWLREHWEQARYLYIAAHAATNPNLPFSTLLVLALPAGATDLYDGFLDVGDVLAADLNGCDLAVLSGCATGAPRVGGGATAPSFGDAFLDAGAAAVVRTFWDVRDDAAARAMHTFMTHWRDDGLAAPIAINRAQRELAAECPHPHYWAAYSIEVTGRIGE